MAKAKINKVKAQSRLSITGQFSRCVEISTYKDRKGLEREIYHMVLDDDETRLFSLFERVDFKLELGACCVPVVAVIPSAYIDKHGQPKPQNVSVVNWVLAKRDAERGEDVESEEEL